MESKDGEFKDVLSDFRCPISHELMKNPTVNEIGHTYEFESIMEWYALGHRTDPLTQRTVQNLQLLIPNHNLRSKIQEWVQRYPEMRRKKMEKSDFETACKIYARDHQAKAQKQQQQQQQQPQQAGVIAEEGKEEEESKDRNEEMRHPNDWTEEEMASFVSGLGGGAVWQGYAELCVREGIDGSTVLDAKLEDLTEYGIRPMHARKILKKVKQAAGIEDSPADAVAASAPASVPLVPEDVERLDLCGSHSELLQTCEAKIQEAKRKLSEQEASELQRLQSEFKLMREHIDSEELRLSELVTTETKSMHSALDDALKTVQQNTEEFKEKEHQLQMTIRSATSWSDRKKRTADIVRITQSALEKVQPCLVRPPVLALEFSEVCTPLLRRSSLATVRMTRTRPTIEDRFTLESATRRQERLEREHVEFLKSQSWSVSIAAMQSERGAVAACVHGDKLYAVGGHDGSSYLNTVECYDFKAKSWSYIAPMQSKRGGAAACVHGDKLYAVGGYDGSSDLNTGECYDFKAKSWSYIAPMQSKRGGVAACVHGDKLYAVGGTDRSSKLNTVECYDFKAKSWSYIAPMQSKRYGVAACVHGDKLYAVGGYDGSSKLNTVECYDFKAKSWSYIAPMQSKRDAVAACVHGDKLYAVGGYDGSSSLNTVECYDFKAKSWSYIAPIQSKRHFLAACVHGDKLHVVGGCDGKSRMNTVESLLLRAI